MVEIKPTPLVCRRCSSAMWFIAWRIGERWFEVFVCGCDSN